MGSQEVEAVEAFDGREPRRLNENTTRSLLCSRTLI